MGYESGLDRESIRGGHERLLDTLREFAGEVSAAEPDVETLHGLVAFLRQGVLAFAHREEAALAEAGDRDEGPAREHAFLAVETGRLAEEVDRLLRAGATGAGTEPVLARIRRLAYRIEAVLEVHALRDEECVAAAPRPEAAGAVEKFVMSAAEVERFLRDHAWGVLSTFGEGRPYAVPVTYAYDEGTIYVATGPGRKARNVESCPGVCLTVAEVHGITRWRSVVAVGRAEWIREPTRRLRALRLLARARGGGFSAKDAARAATARLIRITPDELTGRGER